LPEPWLLFDLIFGHKICKMLSSGPPLDVNERTPRKAKAKRDAAGTQLF
jgi:hypothetical protein